MAMYHDNPRRSEPPRFLWFSVSTPSVFREYRLPASNADWSPADHKKRRELDRLARAYGTAVTVSEYQRG